METLLANTYENLILIKKNSILRNAGFNSPVSFERDPNVNKLEYDVFSRILDITGMNEVKQPTSVKSNIVTPSVEDCIKELIAIENSKSE